MKPSLYLILFFVFMNCFVNSETIRRLKSNTHLPFREGGATNNLVGLDIHLPEPLGMVRAYLGVRYAALGKMTTRTQHRFGHPVATFKYFRISGTIYHDVFQPVCPQNVPQVSYLKDRVPKSYLDHVKRMLPFLHNQVEECLFLNIYTPVINSGKKAVRHPVLIFVHGDSFEWGTGNAYDTSVLTSFAGVITVTLNYRLGTLGFFATDNGESQGNYALMDLRDALQWVHSNIGQFGGDPARITLMGHGYGASLVNLLMTSRFAQVEEGEKFMGVNNVILLGGSAASPWATSQYFNYYTKLLLEKLNISGKHSDLMETLRFLPFSDILVAENNIPQLKYSSRMGPVPSQSSFFSNDITAEMGSINSGFAKANLLIGFGQNSAYHLFKQFFLDAGIDEFDRDRILRTFVRQNFKYQQQKIFDILTSFYTDYSKTSVDGKDKQMSLMHSTLDLLTDGMFAAPCIKTARIHASTRLLQSSPKNAYLFVFGYSSSVPGHHKWAGGLWNDDLSFLLGAPLLSKSSNYLSPFPKEYFLEDRMLSEAFMRYLSNFILSG